MFCEYNQYKLTCFFRNNRYRFKNCPFGYLRKNNFNILSNSNDYKKYFNDENYNVFTEILKPSLKRGEYANIYNFLKNIIEINKRLKNILEIYNKILKKENIIEDLRAILIDITLDQLKNHLDYQWFSRWFVFLIIIPTQSSNSFHPFQTLYF